MTGDFYENDVDEYGWNNGVADYPTLFTGGDMACYEDSIREAVEHRNGDDGGNLMPYFDENRSPGVQAKVVSAIPSVEIRDGELMGCTTVKLRESLTESEMEELQEYLKGQFSDGWGEGFEQQEIQTSDGILSVHFWNAEYFTFEVEQVQSEEPVKKPPIPKRPKMKLGKWDGNVLSILNRADLLLRENGQLEQAKEMTEQFCEFYRMAVGIISHYVEIEIPEKSPKKSKNEKERGDAR